MQDISAHEITIVSSISKNTQVGLTGSLSDEKSVGPRETKTREQIRDVQNEHRLRLNKGHTDDIKKYLPGLMDNREVLEQLASGSEPGIMHLPIETLVKYLESQYQKNPHAIADTLRLVGEELMQIQSLSSILDAIDHDLNDKDFADYLEIDKESLIFWLTTNPQQMFAVDSLLDHPKLNELKNRYLEEYGSEQRQDEKGRVTAQTNTENLEELIRNIQKHRVGRLKGLGRLKEPQTVKLLENVGLPIALPPQFEELLAISGSPS